MAGGWKSNGRTTTRTVFGPHPWSIAELALDALYGRSMDGEGGMVRSEAQSATNSSRFMGDLGPLQRFTQVPAASVGVIPVKQSALPSANGKASSPNPLLDLIGTIG